MFQITGTTQLFLLNFLTLRFRVYIGITIAYKIKALVKKFHSSPSTSSESERLFSAAKLAVGNLRKRISQERLEKQLYIHHNTLLLGFD
jgi:hypothetical protein